MKILVTGNMGYVGPSVVRQLRQSLPEATIVGIDIGYFSGCLLPQDYLPEVRLDQQLFADVRHLPNGILDGVDGVIHLAGISNDPMGSLYQEVTMEINHRATISLANEAKRSGVKSFVFASSCSVYGTAEDEEKNEQSAINPLTEYARSKAESEKDLKPLADDGFTVTCLRFATACGLSERLRLDLVLNDFVAGAIASGEITVLSDGSPWRPLINVKDMARAFEWALLRNSCVGGSFLSVNAGCNAGNYQVKDLAQAVARLIPGVKINLNKNAATDKRSYRVNFDLFKRLAPYHQPVTELESSILELKEGLQSINFSDEKFRLSHFMRLVQLNHLREKGLLDQQLQWRGSLSQCT